MATRKIASRALAAGCTAVLKPAEAAPLMSLLFGELLAKAGLPAGVVSVILSSRPAEVSKALRAYPDPKYAAFANPFSAAGA